ncbi:MAG: c-type cytochrome [Limisphaerales bacterium]
MQKTLLTTCLGFVALAVAGADKAQLARGKALYEGPGSCVICHLADGKGQPGAVPPLAKSNWLDDSNRTIAITLRGLIGPVKVNNKRYYSAMPPQLLFDDAKLTDIINYVHNSWGNKLPDVTVGQVAEARKELGPDIFTPEKVLKKFPFPKGNLRKWNGTFKPDFDDAIKDVTVPVVYRTFMPGASPAAFAVALPGNQFYCWDAGESRLRYVWAKGGFIRGNRVHWSSNGKPVAEFYGDPYYRARSSLLKPEDYEHLNDTNRKLPFYDTAEAPDFPISIEGATGRPAYKGYRLLDGYPEFRYRLGKHEIRELLKESGDKKGIVRTFSVKPAVPMSFSLTPTELAVISSSAGTIAKDGSLKLSAKQSANFSITIIEKNPAPPLPGASFE